MALQLSIAEVRDRGFDAAEAVHTAVNGSRSRLDEARDLAKLAEYLAVELHGHPEQSAAAAAALEEWTDGDPTVLLRAREQALGDTNLDTLRTEVLAMLGSAGTTLP